MVLYLSCRILMVGIKIETFLMLPKDTKPFHFHWLFMKGKSILHLIHSLFLSSTFILAIKSLCRGGPLSHKQGGLNTNLVSSLVVTLKIRLLLFIINLSLQ
jgi:hypothetical protein